MFNFEYQNPTKIIFGKGQIAAIAKEVPAGAKVLLTYGGGSIKANGVYEQTLKALADRTVVEFGGIEPNPEFATLMRAVELGRKWAAARRWMAPSSSPPPFRLRATRGTSWQRAPA